MGGLREGKRRKDGLVPGTQEAIEADREKARLRKAAQRAKSRAADPPPLPAASLANQPLAPGADLGALPGLEADPAFVAGPVPWDDKILKPIFVELIPTIEAHCMTSLQDAAAQARLPEVVQADITREAAWPESSRKLLLIACPQLAAKYLNKTGISSENAPEVMLATAIASIALSHTRLLSRIKAVGASANVQLKPEEKK